MSRRNPESRDFAVGLAVTCLIVAGFFAYTHWNSPSNPPADDLPVIATVYECNGADGRVLSDRPCGDDARVREVVQPNLMPGSADRSDTKRVTR